jgi:aspartate/methionine/tyrosine aminotransferase
MPAPPGLSPATASIKASIYSALIERAAARGKEVYPLHVGDTWLEPPEGCKPEDILTSEHPGLNLYTSIHGMPDLLEAIRDHQEARTGLRPGRGEVLVTAGATSGLANAVGAIVAPGEEVLILAPYWPLIAGIVRCFGALPVPVPFFGVADAAETAIEIVRSQRTSRTVALYVNTPNNPTGSVIPSDWIETLVAWAASEGLWVVSDEVYEDTLYEGAHTYARPLAPERTVAAHSLSKAYGMAGYRCGYLIGPAPLLVEAAKISTHTIYSTPTASQVAALHALGGAGDAWVAKAKPLYRAVKDRAAERLGVPSPPGSTFLFLDVAEHLRDDGLGGFLTRCADEGLLLAPGPSFGPYPTHVRVCYTSAPPEVVMRGVEVLAHLLGR